MPKGRVYGLKGATPRMKHVHMNHVMQFKDHLADEQDKEAERKRQAREVEEIQAEADATRRCIALEGEQSFYEWWNSDAVPNFGPRKKRIEMIEQRILELSTHEGSVSNEKEDGEKSQQEANP